MVRMLFNGTLGINEDLSPAVRERCHYKNSGCFLIQLEISVKAL